MKSNFQFAVICALGGGCLAWMSGCAIPQAEECCPTDIRQMHCSVGEDAIRQSPCGPDTAYYGHKPTCWREWPANWPLWKQQVCATHVEECHPMAPIAETVEAAPTLAPSPGGEPIEAMPTPGLPPLPPALDGGDSDRDSNQDPVVPGDDGPVREPEPGDPGELELPKVDGGSGADHDERSVLRQVAKAAPRRFQVRRLPAVEGPALSQPAPLQNDIAPPPRRLPAVLPAEPAPPLAGLRGGDPSPPTVDAEQEPELLDDDVVGPNLFTP